jgi:1-deoxy-D-xylulose-5-phosphate synthase
LAYLRHIPNMVVMMPKDENELRHMLKTAIDYNDGPIAVRYPRMNSLGVHLDPVLQAIPIGSWETIRAGQQTAIIAIGPMVQVAQQAAERLEKDGKSVRVINARFVKPLDEVVLRQLASERIPVLVLEETSMMGGLGSAILEWYALNGVVAPPLRLLGIPDVFIEHGSIREQREEIGLTVDNVIGYMQQMHIQIRKGQLA